MNRGTRKLIQKICQLKKDLAHFPDFQVVCKIKLIRLGSRLSKIGKELRTQNSELFDKILNLSMHMVFDI